MTILEQMEAAMLSLKAAQAILVSVQTHTAGHRLEQTIWALSEEIADERIHPTHSQEKQ